MQQVIDKLAWIHIKDRKNPEYTFQGQRYLLHTWG